MRLLLDLLFSSIGGAYLIYGKRQFNTAFLVCGFILCVYPYFIDNIALCVVLGLVVTGAPFLIRHVDS